MGVLLDVSSFIGAQEYIVSQNQRDYALRDRAKARPTDPYAKECFVHVVQSLIFQPRVVVAHPILPSPSPADFGREPAFLQELFRYGLVEPLVIADRCAGDLEAAEGALYESLRERGVPTLAAMLRSTAAADEHRAPATGVEPFAVRASRWTAFQQRQVLPVGGHIDRIGSPDGVELDVFGHWVRSLNVAHGPAFKALSNGGDPTYVLGMLARGLRYNLRAEVCDMTYQAHPLRTDFCLAFDLGADGGRPDQIAEAMQAIRGISAALREASQDTSRVDLVEIELPLLGGRLWSTSETGTMSDARFITVVAERIASYRERARDLRLVIARASHDDDVLRLKRDIHQVRVQLLQELGLRGRPASQPEQDLLEAGKVLSEVAGVPNIIGALVRLTMPQRSLVRRGKPHQQFLYREFLNTWDRAAD